MITPASAAPHDLLHLRQEHVSLGRPAVLLEPIALIGCHRKGLLLHRHRVRVSDASTYASTAPGADFFSVALILLCQ